MKKTEQPCEKHVRTKTMLEAFAMGLAAIVSVAPVVIIMCYMDKLNVWWFPLLLLYFALFFTVVAFIVIPESASKMHAMLGSYNFYKAYPQELARKLRQVRRIPDPNREKVIASYRDRMAEDDTDVHIDKLNQWSKNLFFISGTIVTALALWCIVGLFLAALNGEALNIARLFRAGAAFMMILSAFFLFKQTPKHVLHGFTCVLLLFGAWAEFWQDYSEPVNSDIHFFLARTHESMIILVIFIAAAFVLASIARGMRKSIRTHHDHQQFLLDMYEIGVFDEKELEARFLAETH